MDLWRYREEVFLSSRDSHRVSFTGEIGCIPDKDMNSLILVHFDTWHTITGKYTGVGDC
jgi:hypothetical protein